MNLTFLNKLIEKHLRSVVYGGTDGIITIFGIVSGSSGASLGIGVMFIIGLASLCADAISMAVSDYMSQIAEQEMEKHKAKEMELDAEKGTDSLLRNLEAHLTARSSDKYSTAEISALSKLLIRDRELSATILKVESEADETPFASAITTLVAFLAFGVVPLIASLIFASIISPFVSSSIWTLITLFALGWFKAQWTHQKPLTAGLQMAALGGTSSLIAYVIANILSGVYADPSK